MAKAEDETKGLSSVRKSFDIVEAIWDQDGATMKQLTEALDIPTSTVHIHLQTLEDEGYVTKNPEGEYQLSLRFLTYGEYVKQSHPLAVAASETVETLADQTEERVLCMTEQFGLGTILCVGEGDQSIRTDANVGTNAYMHCSAGGKAMLAHYPEEHVHSIIDKWGLPELTDNTITDRDELLEELETVREEGFAVCREEYFEGVLTIGAPVLKDDMAIGAIVVLGPSLRLYNERDQDELREKLLAATNTIEVNIRLDGNRSV